MQIDFYFSQITMMSLLCNISMKVNYYVKHCQTSKRYSSFFAPESISLQQFSMPIARVVFQF